MKQKTRNTIFIILGVIAFVFFILFLIWFACDDYDQECLIEIATNYCESNNLTYFLAEGFYQGKRIFECKKNIDLRINPYGNTLSFYFLPEEPDKCLIKSAWSLKSKEGKDK